MKTGVIIGRFQTPYLTQSHKQLIDEVIRRSDNLIILVGQSDVRVGRRYSLPFVSIKKMLEDYVLAKGIWLRISPIHDQPSNHYWSEKVDEIIGDVKDEIIVLYGGRDSFIPYYFGKHYTEVLDIGVKDESATKIRESIKEPMTEEARKGAIWASYYKYPTMYQVIDAVIFNNIGQVLLCRKEGCVYWQLVGGFVDPEDESLEMAVKREVREETGLEVSPKYQFSIKISDYRYLKEADKVMSHVFLCTLGDNSFYPEPADDIIEARWFDPNKLPTIMSTHEEILNKINIMERKC